MKRWILPVLTVMAVIACAGRMSEQARSQVTYAGPFATVQEAPDTYRGETVMWGGRVIDTMAKDDATEIIVLQLTLSGQDRPSDNDQSQGRFIVRSSRFLDPAIYSKGTLITVIGSVRGAEKRTIGEMAYNYPVMDVVEIKKWKPTADSSPRFHFGFGIGKTF